MRYIGLIIVIVGLAINVREASLIGVSFWSALLGAWLSTWLREWAIRAGILTNNPPGE